MQYAVWGKRPAQGWPPLSLPPAKHTNHRHRCQPCPFLLQVPRSLNVLDQVAAALNPTCTILNLRRCACLTFPIRACRASTSPSSPEMAAADITADFSQRNEGGPSGASTSLFSKFARSPSRKHKPRPSSESIDAAAIATAKAARIRARPPAQRGTTAPDGAVTLNSVHASAGSGEVRPRKASDGAPVLLQSSETHTAMFGVPALNAADLAQNPQYKIIHNDIPKVPPIMGAGVYNPVVTVSLANPNTLYQHIHDMSSKRMATLEYMRKA